MMIRDRFSNTAATAALAKNMNLDQRQTIFEAMDRIISNCTAIIEVDVKLGGGDLFRSMDRTELEIRRSKILETLKADIEHINAFCLSQGQPALTDASPDEFAWDFVREYFQTRAR